MSYVTASPLAGTSHAAAACARSSSYARLVSRSLRRRAYPEIPILSWDDYERFEVDWPSYEDEDGADVQYMYGRGFTTSDLMEWRIGFDNHSDRITIPVSTPEGYLVGVKGRAWSKSRQDEVHHPG